MECSFCGHNIKQGTGLVYVKVDGTVLSFCSRKCMSYYMMKRDPRKFKWTINKKEINR